MNRSWVFPSTTAERRESAAQPTSYMSFPDEFKQSILIKEARNEVFWLKPPSGEPDYNKVSAWFASIPDITSSTGTTIHVHIIHRIIQ
jgi:hypothetical protein